MKLAAMIILGLAMMGLLVVARAISTLVRTITTHLRNKLKLPKGS